MFTYWLTIQNVFPQNKLAMNELNFFPVVYRYELGKNDAHAVEKEMERLFAMGYRWGHLYTQCVLQTLLESIRRG